MIATDFLIDLNQETRNTKSTQNPKPGNQGKSGDKEIRGHVTQKVHVP